MARWVVSLRLVTRCKNSPSGILLVTVFFPIKLQLLLELRVPFELSVVVGAKEETRPGVG